MGNYQKLRVWQSGKDLAVKIYKLTQNRQFLRDYGLKDQIQRASVSIPSNIAEGDELGTNKQSIPHLFIAKGSVAELQTLLIISREISYLDEDTFKLLDNECNKLSIILAKLIKARSVK